jgi:hypothetical protein
VGGVTTLRTRWRATALVVSLVVGASLLLAGPARAATPNAALLTGVDVQDLGTFDRVTFQFRSEPGDPVPTIRRAEYVDRPILADPSGMEVTVEGGAVLKLVLGGASAVDTSVDPPQPGYTGPTRIAANLPSVVEVVETGDFEAVLSWAIGVRDGAAGGTAQVLIGPTRVIVDVPHVTTAVLAAPRFTG